jgi:secretion/DNA translocation related CpaE-like protein
VSRTRPPRPPDGGEADLRGVRPLIVCADDLLLDELLRLSAAAGVEPQVAPDAGSALPFWACAPVVLVGSELADEVAGAGLPRRPEVALVSQDLDDGSVWRRAVAVGASEVVLLPDGADWVVEVLADAAVPGRGGVVVCVVGGRGGAGASTLSAAVAIAAMREGMHAVLVDGDPLGGGLDLVLGGEDVPGVRWPDLAGARGRVPPADLTAALPEVDALHVLSWDRSDVLDVGAEAMESVLRAATHAADLVVVDLPRRPDESARVALQRARATFLLVPAEVRAVSAAGRVAALVRPLTASLRVVVRGPAPSGLDADTVAEALGLPLAGYCRAEPGLALSLERGLPPGTRRGPLGTLAARLLDDVLAGVRGAP